MTDPKALYFLVVRKQPPVFGFCWRVGWGATSFYLKPRHAALSMLKVSLHGPDDRPGLKPGFRFYLDQSAAQGFAAANGAVVARSDVVDTWFPGVKVAPNVRHVVRIRNTWDMFEFPSQSAPHPGQTRRDARHYAAPIPPKGSAVDIDIFVSDDRPYWRRPAESKRSNARLGPLKNQAGQSLTAVSHKRSVLLTPTPEHRLAPRPTDARDRIRGVSTGIDDDGLLWIVETTLSRSFMAENNTSTSLAD